MSRRASERAGLRFTEQMTGDVGFGERDHALGAQHGRASGTRLTIHLTIHIEDLDRFSWDRQHRATAEGWVQCEALGGRLPVERGTFDLFPEDGPPRELMRYRIFFRDTVDHPLTLAGTKVMRPGLRVWRDTSTLYARVRWGHVEDGDGGSPAAGTAIVASGILRLHPLGFLRQLTTFRASGPTLAARLGTVGRFDARFLGHLWQRYGRRMPRRSADGRLQF